MAPVGPDRPVRGHGSAAAAEAGDPACKAQLRDAVAVPPHRPREASSRVRPVVISMGVIPAVQQRFPAP